MNTGLLFGISMIYDLFHFDSAVGGRAGYRKGYQKNRGCIMADAPSVYTKKVIPLLLEHLFDNA